MDRKKNRERDRERDVETWAMVMHVRFRSFVDHNMPFSRLLYVQNAWLQIFSTCFRKKLHQSLTFNKLTWFWRKIFGWQMLFQVVVDVKTSKNSNSVWTDAASSSMCRYDVTYKIAGACKNQYVMYYLLYANLSSHRNAMSHDEKE